MKLLKQHKSFLMLLFILIVLNSTAVMITPVLLNKWMVDNSNIEIKQLGSIVVLLVLSYVIQIIIIYLREHFALRFNINQTLKLVDRMFGLTYDDINNQGPTYLLERISISVNSLYMYLSEGFVQIFTNVIMIIFIIIFVFNFKSVLACVLLALLPINYFGYRILNKELQKRSKIMQSATSNGWKDMINICQQTDFIKQLGSKQALYKSMEEPLLNIYGSMAKVNSFAQSISATLHSINELLKNFMILFLAYDIIGKGGSPLSIVIFSIIFPIYFNAINGITGANIASRDLKNSNEFIEYLEKNQEPDGNEIISEINEIEFKVNELTINDRVIQSDINGIFNKGDIVSINGDSGVGKSTLMKLIPKFRETESIYINSIDIKLVDNKTLRDKIIYMSQDVPIITGTLKENIFLGVGNGKNDIEKVKGFSLIEAILENKSLDTVIEENGANLSGGEKQKVALCRTFLSEADVIILDEITSNIDKHTANEIYSTISSIYKEKIVFIISHDKIHLPYCNKNLELYKD